MIFIRYYYQTANTTALLESTDEPAGQLTYNLPNPDGFRDFHRTRPGLTIRVCC